MDVPHVPRRLCALCTASYPPVKLEFVEEHSCMSFEAMSRGCRGRSLVGADGREVEEVDLELDRAEAVECATKHAVSVTSARVVLQLKS